MLIWLWEKQLDWLPVDDGVHQNLDGVAVCEQIYDVKGMLDDSHLQTSLLAA